MEIEVTIIRPVYMGCTPCTFNTIEFLPIKKKKAEVPDKIEWL
jgi:hypothetical protein